MKRRMFLKTSALLTSLACSMQKSLAAADGISPQQRLQSIADLGKKAGRDGSVVVIASYYPGETQGGAKFKWDGAKPKSLHNGGSVIDPDRDFPLDPKSSDSWYGAAKTPGKGCWVMLNGEELDGSQYGIKADGVTRTSAFQAFLKDPATKKVLRLNGGELVTGTVWFGGDSLVQIENGAIVDDGSLRELDRLLCISNVSNLSVIGKNVAVRQKTRYGGGEHRHNFFISDGAENIKLDGFLSEDAWGDGLYIGPSSAKVKPPAQIQIKNFIANGCRRLGMAVTGVNDLIVEDSQFIKTGKGRPGMVPPAAGLDIEPNFPTAIINNIKFFRCVFSDSVRQGVVVSLQRLRSNSPVVGISFEDIKVIGNYIGILTQGCPPGLKGMVQFQNVELKNQRANGMRHRDWSADGALVRYVNARGIDNNQTGGGSEKRGWGADFVTSVEGNFSVGDVGNIEFINCESTTTQQGKIQRSYGGFVAPGKSGRLRGVRHENSISKGGQKQFYYPQDADVKIK